MATKQLLKAQAFFKRNVEEFLESVGATKTVDGFVIHSSIGQLRLWIYDCWVASRFDDPFFATIFTKGVSNRYSGKFNFIYHNDPETLNNGLLIADFVYAIEKLLAYRPTAEEIRKANQLRRAASQNAGLTPTRERTRQ